MRYRLTARSQARLSRGGFKTSAVSGRNAIRAVYFGPRPIESKQGLIHACSALSAHLPPKAARALGSVIFLGVIVRFRFAESLAATMAHWL